MSQADKPGDQADTGSAERLPVAALLALAMTGFICIMTETLPAGLLPQLSLGLSVSPSLAGQTITVYALGSLLAAIPLTLATRGWQRRNVLLLTIAGFLVFNSATAWSSSYTLTLVARFMAGASAGLAWSLLAGYARRMVAPHLQGRALAIAMVGTPVALSLGTPLGTWMGAQLGWHLSFAAMSLLTLLLIGLVLAKVPDYPGQSDAEALPLRHVFCTPGVRPVLGVVMTWMLAHNILYTYVAPFVSIAKLGQSVDAVLLVFGMAALSGIWIASRIVDHHLRNAVLVSLAAFALVALVFGFTARSPMVVYAGVGIWGLTFGGAATLLQTALADAAGDGADVALSLNVVVWNGAISGGALFGGVLLDHFGATSFPWAMLALLIVGFAVAFRAHPHGFPRGDRLTATTTPRQRQEEASAI